jgi:hypothetical protein
MCAWLTYAKFRKETGMNIGHHHDATPWVGALGTAVLGAAAMYAFDPDRGRRRRAIARDKARRLAADFGEFAGTAARDASHRVQGLRARALGHFRDRPVPDDLVLIERVRARLGRVVSHPHAIQVGARDGRVALSGAILADEAGSLLRAVRSVRGVREIDDHLVTHAEAGSIPALQGNSLAATGGRIQWSPSLRAAIILGGVLIAICGAVAGARRSGYLD